MKILILEDSPQRIKQFRAGLTKHQLFITDKVDEALNELRIDTNYEMILLDNDLGHKLEGRDLANYIELDAVREEPYIKSIRKIIIHSSNIVAAQYMRGVLKQFDAEHIPFTNFPIDILNEVT